MYPLKITLDNGEYYKFYWSKDNFSLKEISVYCNKSPKLSSSLKEKVCVILLIYGDINIYTYEGTSFCRYEIYEVIKGNIDKFLNEETSF